MKWERHDNLIWDQHSNLRVGVQQPWVEEYSPQAVGTQTRVDEQSPREQPSKAGKMRPCSKEQAGTEVVARPENHTPIQSVDPDRLPDAGFHHHRPQGVVAAERKPRQHGKRFSPEAAETSARTWKQWRF